MALLDNKFKQRMVGALVLIALAVIFLPMLFSRQDEARQVRVDAPAAPQAPAVPVVQVEPVAVPKPQVIPEDEPVVDAPQGVAGAAPVQPSAPIAATPAPTPAPAVKLAPAQKPVSVATATPPAAAAAPSAPASAKRIDVNGLPESWSVQLASLSSRANADSLQKTLRTQGYNAYIRSTDGMNRVYVGPLIERAEADRLNDQLSRQQKLKGFVVRFQPERS